MMTTHERSGTAVTGPVFVGGDHRSGTTLMSIVLDSHPDVVCGPELDFLDPVDLGPHVLECIELLARADPSVAGAGVLTADPGWQLGVQFVKQCHRFGIGPDILRRLVAEQVRTTAACIDGFEDRCRLIRSLGELRRQEQGARLWGLKIQRLIANGRFVQQWSDAFFIHIVRDGRDVAASHLRSGRQWAYQQVVEAARGWVDVVEGARRVLPGDRSIEVRYEDLVADPRGVVGEVLVRLGLRWDDAVLHHDTVPHSLFDHPYDHPSAEAAARGVTAAAVGRHRRDLSAAQVAAFENTARVVLRRLGYPMA